MIIQHNLAAMSAGRNFGQVEKNKGKVTEKLSSGYKINRSSDDAAGLQISEKMRSQIRGLNQASTNAQDGISLIQTADGALGEMQSVIQRIRELSVKAGNDTNQEIDREAIQQEVDALVKEVNHISDTTEFNRMKLLDGSLDAESLSGGAVSPLLQFTELLPVENTNEFVVSETKGGTSTAAGNEKLKKVLDEQIVPQAVKLIMDSYQKTFNYLDGANIGIGLNLYSDGSTVLAAVIGQLNGTLANLQVSYQLKINTSGIDMDGAGNLTSDGRTELEKTIAHEMTHAFMDEVTTTGMFGIMADASSTPTYPLWFKEGMAQTSAGPGNWVRGELSLNESSTTTQISAAIKNSDNRLVSGKNSSAYGTGYLACSYLGMMASGKAIVQENVTASNIANGLDTIMQRLANGDSLDTVINGVSGGEYANMSDFETKFGDEESSQFCEYLLKNIGTGSGSVLSENLSDVDILQDAAYSTELFDLDTTVTEIINDYPDEITVLSGGSVSGSGTAPIDDYMDTAPSVPILTGKTIDLSSITVGNGEGYSFDGATLAISSDGDYTITGAKNDIQVKVEDGVTADIILQDVTITNNTDGAIRIGEGSNVTFTVKGMNTITSGTGTAIEVLEGSALTLKGDGTLKATAASGSGAAAIGGDAGEKAGTITIAGEAGKELLVVTNSDTIDNSIGSGTGAEEAEPVMQCGVVVRYAGDGSAPVSNAYGNVMLDRDLSVGPVVSSGASLTIKSGVTVSGDKVGVLSTGTLVNYGTIDGKVDNNGIAKNYGTITGTETGSNQVTHYVKLVTKHITQPSDLTIGETLPSTAAGSITVSYNGGQTADINGTWSIKDKSGNTIADPSAVTIADGDSYDYTITFDLSGTKMKFENGFTSISSLVQAGSKFFAAVEHANVTPGAGVISGDGSSISISYHMDTLAAAPGAHRGALNLQIGADMGQSVSFDIGKMDAASIGLMDVKLDSFEHAGDSILKCDAAIAKVSEERSKLGAYQNRLEHAINNLNTTSENTMAAESRIRDMDMAEGMVEYSKNDILMQAGMSVIAQANQSTEGVLTLIRG